MLPQRAQQFLDKLKGYQDLLPYEKRKKLYEVLRSESYFGYASRWSGVRLNSLTLLTAILSCESFQNVLLGKTYKDGMNVYLPELIKACVELDSNNINHYDRVTHCTALSIAVQNCYTLVIEILLQVPGIDINKPTKKHGRFDESPLMRAIESENIDVVEMLMKRPQIDVNFMNYNGETALHRMKKEIDREVCCLNNRIQKSQTNTSWPIVHALTKSWEKEIQAWKTRLARYEKQYQIILQKNRNIINPIYYFDMKLFDHIRFNRHKIVIDLLENPGFNVNKDDKGITPLLQAIKYGAVEIVKKLLEHPQILVNYGFIPPIICAIRASSIEWPRTDPYVSQETRMIIIDLLLKHPKIDLNICSEGHERNHAYFDETPLWYFYQTPLIAAIQTKNLKLFQTLLNHPALDVNKCVGKQTTHAAKCAGYSLLTSPMCRQILYNSRAKKFLYREVLEIAIEKKDTEFVYFCYLCAQKDKPRHLRFAKFQIMFYWIKQNNFIRALEFFEERFITLVYSNQRYAKKLHTILESLDLEIVVESTEEEFDIERREPNFELVSFLISTLNIEDRFISELWKKVLFTGNISLVQFTANLVNSKNIKIYNCFFPFFYHPKWETNSSVLTYHFGTHIFYSTVGQQRYNSYITECLKCIIKSNIYFERDVHGVFQVFCLLLDPHIEIEWFDILASAPEFDINYVINAEDLDCSLMNYINNCSTALHALTKTRVSNEFSCEKYDQIDDLDNNNLLFRYKNGYNVYYPEAKQKFILKYFLLKFPSIRVDIKDSSGRTPLNYDTTGILSAWIQEKRECLELKKIIKGMPFELGSHIKQFITKNKTLEDIKKEYYEEVEKRHVEDIKIHLNYLETYDRPLNGRIITQEEEDLLNAVRLI